MKQLYYVPAGLLQAHHSVLHIIILCDYYHANHLTAFHLTCPVYGGRS